MSTISSPIISAAVPGGNTLTEKNGPSTTEKDIEMGPMFQPPEAQTMSSFTDTRAGRPDIAHLISSRTENCHPGDRVCVAACGPDKMIDTTRQAVSEASSNPDVSITLHSEVSLYSLPPSPFFYSCGRLLRNRSLDGKQIYIVEIIVIFSATGT